MEDRTQTAAITESDSDSPRLFTNDFLDRLSRVHYLVPAVVYLPVVVVLATFGFLRFGVVTGIASLTAGYLLWTLLEYFGHRFVFHMQFPGKIGQRVHYLIHGVHHCHPSDPLRLVMPPLLSVPILASGFLVLRLAFGPDLAPIIFAGFAAGYVGYDMIHYYVHHAAPQTRLGRLLRQRHMFHHFRNETVLFGVSAPWWDIVFGTNAPVSKQGT